jgi:hypothetical protein
MLMKLLKKIRSVSKAAALLQQCGFEGELDECVLQAMQLIDRQHQAIKDSNTAMESAKERIESIGSKAADAEGDMTVQYFVPYDACFTKYHNGGEQRIMRGMTLLNIKGGINGWDDIMGVSNHIKTSLVSPQGAPPTAVVRVNGIFEVSRWKTQPETQLL